jgi:hypothetical protein
MENSSQNRIHCDQFEAGKVVKAYNGLGDIENRIKEGKKTLR